jgi:hypothetical protein
VNLWTHIQHHRWFSIIFLAVFILATAGGTCWAVFFRTVASPVSLRDALRQYRRDVAGSPTSPAATSAQGPLANGVFGYRTTGGESLSILGVARSFPGATDMIVSDAPASADTVGGQCSVVSWVPITQHTETTTVCPTTVPVDGRSSPAIVVPDFVTYEAISNTVSTTTISCGPTAYLVPPDAATGATWSTTCRQSGSTANVVLTGTDLGPALIHVGNHAVHTTHVHLSIDFTGAESGSSPEDFWLADGRIIQQSETVSLLQGSVKYHEAMRTTLTSLTPTQ